MAIPPEDGAIFRSTPVSTPPFMLDSSGYAHMTIGYAAEMDGELIEVVTPQVVTVTDADFYPTSKFVHAQHADTGIDLTFSNDLTWKYRWCVIVNTGTANVTIKAVAGETCTPDGNDIVLGPGDVAGMYFADSSRIVCMFTSDNTCTAP